MQDCPRFHLYLLLGSVDAPEEYRILKDPLREAAARFAVRRVDPEPGFPASISGGQSF